MSDLGVVVLSYGSGGLFEGAIRSVTSEGIDPSAIVVVHNPSRPGERPEGPIDGAELIVAPYNLGYAAGMNVGIVRQLEREVDAVLLLTHDARFRPGGLRRMLDAMSTHPDHAVLGPVLFQGSDDEPFSTGGETSWIGTVGHCRGAPAHAGAVVDRDWIDGSVMLLRARLLEALGGFDDRLWSYFEEADLCRRARIAGGRVGVVSGAAAEQAPGGKKRLGAWSYLSARNGLEHARRSVGWRGVLLLLPWVVLTIAFHLARVVPRAATRGRDPREPWVEAVGTLRGALDFAGRRFGPPPRLPGSGDVGNTAPGVPEDDQRLRVLHLGPDPEMGGGMSTVIGQLLSSSLGDRFTLDFVPTYRGADALTRLSTFAVALARMAAWRLRRRGRLVHVHATVRGSAYRKSIAVILAKALGCSVILHVHSGPGDIQTFRQRLGRIELALVRTGLRAADVRLAVSSASAAEIARAYGVEGIEHLPNPAPAATPVDGASLEQPARILYLGGFANPVKGGEILLASLHRVLDENSAFEIVLAGPGDLPPAGRVLVEADDRVNWLGWLAPEAARRELRRSNVFVLPSTSEGLPMALLEAMATGLAIVATAVGGVPDVVRGEHDAVLVDPAEPEQLAAALGRVIASGDLRRELGLASRVRAAEFDEGSVTDRLTELYESLVGPATMASRRRA